MTRVAGTLTVSLADGGYFLRVFTPSDGNGNAKPLAAKYSSDVESELITVFGFPKAMAQSFMGDVERNREASAEITVDEPLARTLVADRR